MLDPKALIAEAAEKLSLAASAPDNMVRTYLKEARHAIEDAERIEWKKWHEELDRTESSLLRR